MSYEFLYFQIIVSLITNELVRLSIYSGCRICLTSLVVPDQYRISDYQNR